MYIYNKSMNYYNILQSISEKDILTIVYTLLPAYCVNSTDLVNYSTTPENTAHRTTRCGVQSGC